MTEGEQWWAKWSSRVNSLPDNVWESVEEEWKKKDEEANERQKIKELTERARAARAGKRM